MSIFPRMGETLIEVSCDLCGKSLRVRPRVRKRGWGRFHQRCAQIARALGPKNANYRGGRSYHSHRLTREQILRIRERDQHRCVKCGRPDRTIDPNGVRALDVHHVVSVREGGPDTDDNLVSLCRKCHNRIEHGRDTLVWPPAALTPARASQSPAGHPPSQPRPAGPTEVRDRLP